jgi:hypothetical protein
MRAVPTGMGISMPEPYMPHTIKMEHLSIELQARREMNQPLFIPKVYLASRFGRREELIGYAERLKEVGFECTSRWLVVEHDGANVTDEMRQQYGTDDLEDVGAADIMINFTESRDGSTDFDLMRSRARGGRHVELGFALGRGLSVYIVGPKENVFHHVPNVIQFETFEDCLSYLKSLWLGEARLTSHREVS